MTKTPKLYPLPAYAIVRVDAYLGEDPPIPARITIKRVVWSLELAESEVARLSAINPACAYFWQYTRVDPTRNGERLVLPDDAESVELEGPRRSAIVTTGTAPRERERLLQLIELVNTFVSPMGERTIAAANRVESALDDLLGDDPVFADFVTDLAQYSPFGGDHMLDEAQLVTRLGSLLVLLNREISPDP